MNSTTTPRIAAFFAAAVVSTVLVGSQFGLARHYSAEGFTVLAGQPSLDLMTLASAPATAG